MNIHITGRHVEITQGMRDHITEKLNHLGKLFDRIILDVNVVLSIEHSQNIAEATLHMPHQPAVHATAYSGDMYSSIDMMTDKLKTQIQKHKEKEITERDHRKHGAGIEDTEE
jgi:putative sigma-54 modulation protein